MTRRRTLALALIALGTAVPLGCPPGGLAIYMVEPQPAAAGATITVTGTGFGATQDASELRYDGEVLTVSAWADTQIQAALPDPKADGIYDVQVFAGGVGSNVVQHTIGAGGAVDITDAIFAERSGDCATYANDYVASVFDLQRAVGYNASVGISAGASACTIASNAIPNHDFNDASAAFAHTVAYVQRTFNVPRNPNLAGSTTALALTSWDAILLNGVVVDELAAGCYGVGDGMIGCFDINTPWRYDPMSPLNHFGTDLHHAHTQPDGTYHYHGNPVAMFDEAPGPQGSPVIGFAADGFPIYGSYFFDGTGVRKAVSGYTLKTGTRPDGAGQPGGTYDGTFIDDYEFTGAGDLDECNGMEVDGQYGYYVTDSYPWIVGCFSGTPDPSFSKF